MTIADIEEATKVKKSTFYRWKDGTWTQAPRVELVKSFCEGLGVPVTTAYAMLGWSAEGADAPSEEPHLEPDIVAVLRKLRDPNTSIAEKYHIRRTLAALARQNGIDKPDSGQRNAV